MKDGKLKYAETAAVALGAASLAIVIAYANSSLNFTGFLMYFIPCISSFAVIYALYSRSRSLRALRSEADCLAKGLGRVSYYNSSGMPLLKSIRTAARSVKPMKVAIILDEVGRRVYFGQGAEDSLELALLKHKELRGKLLNGIDMSRFDLGKLHEIYESDRKESMTRSVALSNRYATLNMFISTIAPSFLMFSFIGSMLISEASASTEALSFMLVLAVPMAYSFSCRAFNGRFFG